MLPLLFVGLASANGLSLGLALGGSTLTGDSPRGTFRSGAPFAAANVTFRFALLEGWAGLSASGLIAPYQGVEIAAAPLQVEAGFGLGGPFTSGGVYFGEGFSGFSAGLYGRITFETGADWWLDRVGVEGRIFGTDLTEAGGVALLLRVEPAWEGLRPQRRAARRPPPRAPPAPPPQPPAPPPPADEPPLAIPAPDAPPPAEEPPPVHHDDPYGD